MGFFNDINSWFDNNINKPLTDFAVNTIGGGINNAINTPKIIEDIDHTIGLKTPQESMTEQVMTGRTLKDQNLFKDGYFLNDVEKFIRGGINTIGKGFDSVKQTVKNVIEDIKEKGNNESQLEENATEDERANADEIKGTNTSTEREQALEDQQRLWEREDTIRKETQEREDTAYQRAVADMIKAGINPNLINVQPASAGAGITNASPVNYSTTTTELRNAMEEYLLKVKLSTEINENDKDRLLKYITAILGTLR